MKLYLLSEMIKIHEKETEQPLAAFSFYFLLDNILSVKDMDRTVNKNYMLSMREELRNLFKQITQHHSLHSHTKFRPSTFIVIIIHLFP